MFKYKIVSDGPLRRGRTTLFPDQQLVQVPAKDVMNGLDIKPSEAEAFTDEEAFGWLDLSHDEVAEATEQPS